ncbi:patatin-like phospholipase family protein [Desulfovibrio sp. JC022]|uniref:patatin-like phospholipase family protein n=1 Tax=Desulfovibrio sp. JC022 TaxID=2593642 RepID=UPI0013D2BD4E|nr:patatin-like phospholipase family protein [Desulfovibrio sp. JC022]NDV23293.1 patatin [Desulfovibrio sp. JC022]
MIMKFKHEYAGRVCRQLFFFLLLILISGCGLKRNPIPVEMQAQASLPGYDQVRFFGDTTPKHMDTVMEKWAELSKNNKLPAEISFLSLSGGGADGAFGAGFLCGWTDRGDRPTFGLVTGVSTGALIAPFAFMGSDYDPFIEMFYTTFETSDLVQQRSYVSAVSGDSVYSTEPLREALKQFINHEFIAKIAAEHRKGRRLLIGTTNLDAMRPVYWDIGALAQYGTPEADQLIRDVILASASVPVAFPPVYFKVKAGDKIYDEMHVDGGVSNQVFSYPPSIHLAEELEKIGEHRKITLYVIRNDALVTEGVQVEPYIGGIAARSLAGLIRNQGIGDLYRMYYTSQRDGVDFKLTFIPPDYNEEADELFSPVYMTKLFMLGHGMAKAPNPWHTAPPSTTARKGADAVPAEVILE